MKYTLITRQGNVCTFFVREVAELYQVVYGGVVIDETILVDTSAQKTV